MKLPKHIELTLTHNPHASVRDSVREYIKRMDHLDVEWFNQESKSLAIATDDFWECQWYPDTPVGFCIAYAHKLEDLLQMINRE